MNERIREFYVEAFQVFNKCDENYKEMFEKFSELMLGDVLNIVSNGGELCSRPKLVEKLKEHFGVEE